MIMPKNTILPSELLLTLEDHIYEEAYDIFGDLYDESDPERMVEEILEIVRICGWDGDQGEIVCDYFDLAYDEEDTQEYFHDGHQSLPQIFREMIKKQYCWIGILYLLDQDVSGYVSDLIDALEENSDEGYEMDVDSVVGILRKDVEEGEPGRWFS